jgi:cytoskeleton protein RodZ
MPVAQQDRSDEALRSIGRELLEARTARGEDLHDIAAYLRIRPAYLTALEQGDIGAIPGRPYAVGFLRSYGDYLELDGGALVNRLKRAVRDVTAPADLSYREPLSESRRPTAALVTASLMLAMALYTGYQVLSGGRESEPVAVAEAPGELGELARTVLASRDLGPIEPVASQPAPVTAAPAAPTSQASGTPAGATQPAMTASVTTPAPAPAPDVTSAVAAESNGADSRPMVLAALDSDRAPPAAPTAADPAESGRVVIVAREASWLQVRSGGRDYVRTRTLQAGERFVLPDRTDLALWTGNAGGLEILLDGQSVGRLGESGAVLKDLPLGPDHLKGRLAAGGR